MEYRSNDLTLKDIESFVLLPQKTIANALKRKYNRSYRESDKINKTEFKYIIESFSFIKNIERIMFAGYSNSLSGRANLINKTLTEKSREEFDNYIYNNLGLSDIIRPKLIDHEINNETINIELKTHYYGKSGDNSDGYVAFHIKIGDYDYLDVIYNESRYSSTPWDITNDYKKNEKKYITEKKEFLLNHIKAYTVIDIRNEIDFIFKGSRLGKAFLDYKKIDIDIKNLKSKIENDDFDKLNVLLLDNELDNNYENFFSKNILYRTKKT